MEQSNVTFLSSQELDRMRAQRAKGGGPGDVVRYVVLEIKRIYTTQNGKPDNSIMRGEDFTLVMEIEYSTLLGDLGSNFVAKFHVINMNTGTKAVAYSATVTGNLEPGDGFIIKLIITYTVKNAQEEGVFLLAGSIGLPRSLLNDFSIGETVGPPPRALEIANFFVHPPPP